MPHFPAPAWHEIKADDGTPRPAYQKLLPALSELGGRALRAMEDQMEATLREMGVTFDLIRNDPWGRQPWRCDLLPQVFSGVEWERIVRGFRQRLQAFEAFLEDVYGPREILRSGSVPLPVVLASPYYQNAAVGLQRPRGAFLHLGGMCIARARNGTLQVKQHHFSHAPGISYMMQNRRALARVQPELFESAPVQSLAEVPMLIMEWLRETAAPFGGEPTVVLLSPGSTGAVSAEQSFLARRMGIPMVQGGDLVVLDDCVFLKTVRGLERVEVILNRVPDPWLDPLVFQHDSPHGVPGLVHCVRKGTVALVNAVGAQLADDPALLAFTPQIIRFYLGEAPLLPASPTWWLGDIDQRELVLGDPGRFSIRPIFSEKECAPPQAAAPRDAARIAAEVRRQPALYFAQERGEGAATLCFENGRPAEHEQDHLVFALRSGAGFDVLPGALTRVFCGDAQDGGFGPGWTSKDSWVLLEPESEPLMPRLARRAGESGLPARQVTSRVADAFYWMGRYLERAHHQAYLISVIETLETEELNSAERRHYRPMWNRLLPPLENASGARRRSMTNRLDRFRLALSREDGSVLGTFLRALANAQSVQDSLSPEAWATLSHLRARLGRLRFREALPEAEAARATRRAADSATQFIPQFFAICANTMLADDGWRFCEIGQMLERATITANSALSVAHALAPQRSAGPATNPASEMELSAFLRLLGTRDAYRRIYQMRAEPGHVLELLWQHAEAPRSVRRCLGRCGALLRESLAAEMSSPATALAAIETLLHRIARIDWAAFVLPPGNEDLIEGARPAPAPAPAGALEPFLEGLLKSTQEVHTLISDSFLNHQERIAQVTQPSLRGFGA